MKGRSTWMLFLFIAGGAILGGFTADMLAKSAVADSAAFLLTTHDLLNISGIRIDLYVLDIQFGIHFFPNLLSLIFIVLAVHLYRRV